MKRFSGCVLLGLLALGLAFADDAAKPKEKDEKDTFEILVKAILGSLNNTGELLAKVTDEKSAKETKPKLEKVAVEMQGLQERMNKLGKPTPEDEKKLEQKFKGDLETAVKKMTTEAVRLSETDYGKDLLVALKPKPKKPEEKPKDKPAEKKEPGK